MVATPRYFPVFCVVIMFAGCGSRERPKQVAAGSHAAPPPVTFDDRFPPPVPPARGASKQSTSPPAPRSEPPPQKRAATTIHRVFEYREKGFREPKDSEKLVAVDAEFREYDDELTLRDIHILDGQSDERVGARVGTKYLNLDGTLDDDEPDFPLGGTIRLLLVYRVPKSVQSIKLDYRWGDIGVTRANPITEGGLLFDESRLIAGAQFRAYPKSTHYGKERRRGRWLLIDVLDGAAVVDLDAYPPTIDHWDCKVLHGIEPAPGGGWIVLTSAGRRDEDKPAIWHHPQEKPGASLPPEGATTGPGAPLRAIGVLGKRVFAHDQKLLYWFVDGGLLRDDNLGQARGVKQIADIIDYTHGTIPLADGRTILLWDGDGYEPIDGKWKKTWPLEIDASYRFASVPWEADGFYFTDGRSVYRENPRTKRLPVMTALNYVVNIEPGPGGSILFQLGFPLKPGTPLNDALIGLWFPADDTYIPLGVRDITARHTCYELESFYWSEATRHFYVVAEDGLITIPVDKILSRPRLKAPPYPRPKAE